jgi:hypothetical protein
MATTDTNERVTALAARFRAANDEVIRFAERCADADWRMMVPHEGRSVAYLIDHIAWGYAVERKALLANLTGQAPPLAPDEFPHTWTRESLHATNAGRWEAQPYPDREATIRRLRTAGEEMARFIAGLRGQDLERTIAYGYLALPAAAFIERIVIGHPGMHLPGIEQELAGASRS